MYFIYLYFVIGFITGASVLAMGKLTNQKIDRPLVMMVTMLFTWPGIWIEKGPIHVIRLIIDVIIRLIKGS